MTHFTRTRDAARGKWRGILLEIGISESFLKNVHGPCPLCGGKDRFRWDNKEGSGSFYCNQCGPGDGMQLAEKFTGLPFREIAKLIDQFLGHHAQKADPPRAELSESKRRAMLNRTWSQSQPISPGDRADRYLRTRGLGEDVAYPPDLRFASSLPDGEGGLRPAIIALLRAPTGEPVHLQRIFLRSDGSDKAEMASPRKLMPGKVPDGACVRLTTHYATGPLGIAEGIETAMAASLLYDMQVWAALNANMLENWIPPEGCEHVVIFGDNDASFTGQSAAYKLARRLRAKGVEVEVHFPPQEGEDYADLWLAHNGPDQPVKAAPEPVQKSA